MFKASSNVNNYAVNDPIDLPCQNNQIRPIQGEILIIICNICSIQQRVD